MTGVEILSSKTIYNTLLSEWCLVMTFIFAVVFFIITLVLVLNDRIITSIVCIILCVGCICLIVFGGMYDTNSVNYIEYKVTIDDSVSMNEFLDKYEIIDQEGKIYTVRELHQ